MQPNILHSVFIFANVVIVFSNNVYPSSTKYRSRPRRSNMTQVSFYPLNNQDKDADKNYSSLKDKPMYMLPEPSCTCVSTIKDFEECYCKLGCPLPKSKDTMESWLTPLYGDFCQNRKKFGYKPKVAPTFRQRQELLSKRVILACDRPDYPINGRLSFFQFICVLIDNSLTTFQYNSRPTQVDFARQTTLSKFKYNWPIFQTFYDNCSHENFSIDNFESEFRADDKYLFHLHVNQLFQLAPPPLSPIPGKFQPNSEIMCLSDRKLTGESLIDNIPHSEDEMRHQQNPTDILEEAIRNLAQRKVNYLVNLPTNISITPNIGCSHVRNSLEEVSQRWLDKVIAFSKGNASDVNTKKILVEELERHHLMTEDQRLGRVKEHFPSYCYNLLAGLEVHIIYKRNVLFKIEHRLVVNDDAFDPSSSFFVQLQSQTVSNLLDRRLSKFWTQFQAYECPDQYCWRDIFDWSPLQADSLLKLISLVCVVIVTMLLFPRVKTGTILYMTLT